MSHGLFANRSSHKDFIYNAIEAYTSIPTNIYIAVAFFMEADVVKNLLSKGCAIKLIVRLGFPTAPSALKKLLNLPNIQVRYFTDPSFHTKLFIFGDRNALVGSANLTGSALMSNQEIMVSIDSSDQRFNQLAALFSDYWQEAEALSYEAIRKYEFVCNSHELDSLALVQEKADNAVIEKLGRIVASNIDRGIPNKKRENIFIDDYRKTYQECVDAYRVIKTEYQAIGKRKISENVIPLRLEIDSFISYVRDEHTKGDSWMTEPLGSIEDKRQKIRKHIDAWFETYWEHFEKTIAEDHYPLLKKVFTTEDSIARTNDDELLDGLCVLHSFHDRLRFFPDGLPTLKKEFLRQNDGQKIRDSLAYLLFGDGDTIKRMANLIYNSDYKLNEFGQSNVQELIGWSNQEDLPVVNGRTTKVLRYFGFDVRQIG
jgi:HKD family nuclease